MALSRWRAAVGPLLLLITGLCIFRAERLTWGAADVGDGTRYKVSPTVLWHVLKPHQTESPTVECGFGAVLGRAVPRCQFGPGANRAMQRLALVAALLLLASVCAISAALLMPLWEGRTVRAVVAVIPGGLVVIALVLFRPAALDLMSAAGARNGGFGGVGWYLVLLTPVLAVLAAILEWQRARQTASALSSVVALGVAVVFVGVLLLAPRPLGNSIALLTAVAGAVVGAVLALAGLAGRFGHRGATPAV